jgi:H+/Cl- antiporter ClcA
MKTSLEKPTDFSAQAEELDIFGGATRGGVVNRTHRVVRHRARVMQARRSKVRSLMVPLVICSILLILTVVAVWSGLYQYQAAEAAEAVQADVAALAQTDATNHFMVVLLWFVPVSLAVLAALWLRRVRETADSETIR